MRSRLGAFRCLASPSSDRIRFDQRAERPSQRRRWPGWSELRRELATGGLFHHRRSSRFNQQSQNSSVGCGDLNLQLRPARPRGRASARRAVSPSRSMLFSRSNGLATQLEMARQSEPASARGPRLSHVPAHAVVHRPQQEMNQSAPVYLEEHDGSFTGIGTLDRVGDFDATKSETARQDSRAPPGSGRWEMVPRLSPSRAAIAAACRCTLRRLPLGRSVPAFQQTVYLSTNRGTVSSSRSTGWQLLRSPRR